MKYTGTATVALKTGDAAEVAQHALGQHGDAIWTGLRVTLVTTVRASSMQVATRQMEHSVMVILTEQAGFESDAFRFVGVSVSEVE